MSRKQLIIIAVIVLALIVFGGLFGFYYYLNQKSLESPYSTSPLSFFSNLFGGGKGGAPSGGGNGTTNTVVDVPNQVTEGGTTTIQVEQIPLLRHITTTPIAGATAFDRVVATTSVIAFKGAKPKVVNIYGTFLRYMDRATGQVFETATGTLISTKASITTFPQVYNALFDGSGNSLVLQKILNTDQETITTYYGHINKTASSSADGTLSTVPLSNSIGFIAEDPAEKEIFSLVKNSSNGSQGIISNLDGSGKAVAWSSPLGEWLSSWPNENEILLTTKPSANVVGYSYLLNPSTGKFTNFIGYIPGLTVLASPDLSLALVGQSDVSDNSLDLSLFKPASHSTQPFFLKTLPEKCVWSNKNSSVLFCAVPESIPSATYPDDWYKGLVSFSDSIWKINLTTGEANRVGPLADLSGQDIDATNLTLDSTEDYLLFTNKNDLTLWGLRLPSPVVATTTATSTKK